MNIISFALSIEHIYLTFFGFGINIRWAGTFPISSNDHKWGRFTIFSNKIIIQFLAPIQNGEWFK